MMIEQTPEPSIDPVSFLLLPEVAIGLGSSNLDAPADSMDDQVEEDNLQDEKQEFEGVVVSEGEAHDGVENKSGQTNRENRLVALLDQHLDAMDLKISHLTSSLLKIITNKIRLIGSKALPFRRERPRRLQSC